MKKHWHYWAMTAGAWVLYYVIIKHWELDVSIWRFYAAGLVLYMTGVINGQKKII